MSCREILVSLSYQPFGPTAPFPALCTIAAPCSSQRFHQSQTAAGLLAENKKPQPASFIIRAAEAGKGFLRPCQRAVGPQSHRPPGIDHQESRLPLAFLNVRTAHLHGSASRSFVPAYVVQVVSATPVDPSC